MFDPVDVAAASKESFAKSKSRWLSPDGFVFLGYKSSIESNRHPLMPHEARVEELREKWQENANMESTLSRGRWSWDKRHIDFELYKKPPELPVATASLTAAELHTDGPGASSQVQKPQGLRKDEPLKFSLRKPGVVLKPIPAPSALGSQNSSDVLPGKKSVCSSFVPGLQENHSRKWEDDFIPSQQRAWEGWKTQSWRFQVYLALSNQFTRVTKQRADTLPPVHNRKTLCSMIVWIQVTQLVPENMPQDRTAELRGNWIILGVTKRIKVKCVTCHQIWIMFTKYLLYVTSTHLDKAVTIVVGPTDCSASNKIISWGAFPNWRVLIANGGFQLKEPHPLPGKTQLSLNLNWFLFGIKGNGRISKNITWRGYQFLSLSSLYEVGFSPILHRYS